MVMIRHIALALLLALLPGMALADPYTIPPAPSTGGGGGAATVTSSSVTNALGFTPASTTALTNEAATARAAEAANAALAGAAIPAAGGNASATVVTAPTTGGTARTLVTKTQDTINVLDYGADPTGATDSATAFANAGTAAIAAGNSGPRCVYMPGGNYLISAGAITNISCLEGDGMSTSTILVNNTFNSSALGVIQVPSTDTFPVYRNFGMTFVQNSAASSRANYISLAAGCGTGTNGCAYPPAIYDASTSQRLQLQNLLISGAWDGFVFVGNAGGGGDYENIYMGALDWGWQIDGVQDTTKVVNWHEWVFGMGNAGNGPYTVYHDGNTGGWKVGRVDGLYAKNVLFLDANMLITSNASLSEGPSFYDNLDFDGTATLTIAGGEGNVFNNVTKVGNPLSPATLITVSSGYCYFNNAVIDAAGAAPNGYFYITGGNAYFNNASVAAANGTITSFNQTGGTLKISDSYFNMPPTTTVPWITSTGGVTIVTNNVAHNGTSGNAISISTDAVGNYVSDNQFAQYGYSLPTGLTSGIYQTVPIPMTIPNTETRAIGIGNGALSAITSAGTYRDTALGYGALAATTGDVNVAVGTYAAAAATTAGSITAVGGYALNAETAASGSTAIGANALRAENTTGVAGNTAVGSSAGAADITGTLNTLIGGNAGKTLTTAIQDTFVGSSSGQNATGSYESGLGYNSLIAVTGDFNVGLGLSAGSTITSGTSNVCIGPNVCSTTLATGTNNIIIGAGVSVDALTAATTKEINIGNILYYNANNVSAPNTFAGCGTGAAVDAHANNRSGTLTMGTGAVTSCAMTLAGTGYSTWNHCRVTPHATLAAFGYSYSLTAITFTGTSLTSAVVDYDCDGY